MRPCNEVVPLLSPLVDAALPDDDREWVEDHVRGCTACTTRRDLMLAQGAAICDAVGKRAAEADFSGFSDRVMARVGKEPQHAPLGVWGAEMWGAHRGLFATFGGLAVAACMAIAVFFAPQQAASDDAMLLADASAPQVEEVDFGTRDGAVLQLGHDTTVIWMSDDRAVQQ